MLNSAHAATLHLLLPSPQVWSLALQNLTELWQPHDQLLLMSAALHGWSSDQLQPLGQLHPIGLYQPDAQLIALPDRLPEHVQVVSDALWAHWTLGYARCMTWR